MANNFRKSREYQFDDREPKPEKVKINRGIETNTKFTPVDSQPVYSFNPELKEEDLILSGEMKIVQSTPYKHGNAFADLFPAPFTAEREIDEVVEMVNSAHKENATNIPVPKVFVLDSNILINDPRSIYGFDNNEVVIPIVVLEEIDRFKNERTSRSASARAVSRELDKVRQLGDLHKGVILPTGGTLRVECDCPKPSFNHLPGKTYADNVILETILSLSAKYQDKDFILVTEDINLRIRAASMGVEVEEYKNSKVEDVGFYDPPPVIHAESYTVDQLYDLNSSEILEFDTSLQNNTYAVLKSDMNTSALVQVVRDEEGSFLKPVRDNSAYGLKPLNKEQKFALDALLDPNIHLVVLTGFSGTGKSLLGMAAGLEQVVNQKQYQKLVLARPLVGMGNELGFTPGSLDEKLDVWMVPLMDSFQVLSSDKRKVDSRMRGKSGFDELRAHGFIEVESLHHIRGRSMPNIFFQIDEAQNLSVAEMKTILTRAGEGAKIVLCGDVSQIDAAYLTPDSCGLSHVIEKFRGKDIFAHVHFTKGHRSQLADLASNLL